MKHSRRELFEAEAAGPEGAREGLRRIAALYDIEEQIRDQRLTGEAKRLHRLTHGKPHLDAFFASVNSRLETHGLAPAACTRSTSTRTSSMSSSASASTRLPASPS